MAPRKSPRDATCPHCKRNFTKGGLKQHLRYVKCSPSSKASPRKFARVRCKHCHKSFHSTNSLRVHVSTVHPKEYAKAPGLMKYHRAPYEKRSGKNKSRAKTHRDSHRGESPARRSAHTSSHRVRSDSKTQTKHRSPETRRSGTRSVEEGTRRSRSSSWHDELAKQMATAADHL